MMPAISSLQPQSKLHCLVGCPVRPKRPMPLSRSANSADALQKEEKSVTEKKDFH